MSRTRPPVHRPAVLEVQRGSFIRSQPLPEGMGEQAWRQAWAHTCVRGRGRCAHPSCPCTTSRRWLQASLLRAASGAPDCGILLVQPAVYGVHAVGQRGHVGFVQLQVQGRRAGQREERSGSSCSSATPSHQSRGRGTALSCLSSHSAPQCWSRTEPSASRSRQLHCRRR